jgi:predicted membrane chloride channel (bestrophin family)
MIEYDKDRWFGTIKFVGSVLPRSVPQALISVMITLLLVVYADREENFSEQSHDSAFGIVGESVIYEFCTNAYVHQVSMLSISFVIAFRVNLAYTRCAYLPRAPFPFKPYRPCTPRAPTNARSRRPRALPARAPHPACTPYCAMRARAPTLTRAPPPAHALADWEGIGLLLNMRSKWVDAFTQVISFDDPSTVDKSAGIDPPVTEFRVLVAHLFSLLHACAVLEVKKCWDVRCLVDSSAAPVADTSGGSMWLRTMIPWWRVSLYDSEERHRHIQAEVLGGLGEREEEELAGLGASWVEFMHLRIVRVLADRIANGGLRMPAPILSRIFQELSIGTLMCTGAQKIAQVPFPFPFYEMVRLIKYYFVLSNPFILVSFTSHPLVAALLSFMSSLFFVAIVEVAEELEEPFGEE